MIQTAKGGPVDHPQPCCPAAKQASCTKSLRFCETPKHAVRIHRVGEFGENHVGDRQVILYALNRGRDGAKNAPVLAAQVDNEDGELRGC